MSENPLQYENQDHTPTGTQLQYDLYQAQRSLKEIFKSWLPTDVKSFLFASVILFNLIIAVVHFCQTADVSMFPTLLPYTAGYVGLKELTPLILSGKREKNNQHPPEVE